MEYLDGQAIRDIEAVVYQAGLANLDILVVGYLVIQDILVVGYLVIQDIQAVVFLDGLVLADILEALLLAIYQYY